jgi:ribosome-associated protein
MTRAHSQPLPPVDHTAAAEGSSERPSKSQRKREVAALQSLGESLLKLPDSTLARIDMPDDLRQAIGEAARMRSHEARRRQLQYIGRLMRELDAEPLRAAIDNATGESKHAVALMHRCERLRDRLLDDDAALTDLVKILPQADLQQLRATIRAARRERDEGRPPRQARQLYRWLHEQLSQAKGEQ